MLKPILRLNVITPVSRPENLKTIHKNLSELDGMEISWFTVFDPKYERAVPTWRSFVEQLAAPMRRSERILKVEIAVAGREGGCGGSKRSYAISVIADGWCYFLDDDNLMHQNFPKAFRRGVMERPEAQVIVFHQARADGSVRLHAAPEKMKACHFDTGQFVIKRSFIGGTQYAPTTSPWSTIWPDVGTGDWLFMEKFWTANPEQFHFVPAVATSYNALR